MTKLRSRMAWTLAFGCAVGAAATTAATTAAGQAIRIEPRIQLSQTERVRIQAVADQGPDALRRFLWRTRMIYGWTWRDLVAVE